ncbi:serine/threonine-protein kinase [Actinocrispum wychmicini]|uniref:non-specific serine/threonine protein kinase n=1 Tax=Actinocrispum wychmicini TaxID=1213861 RepID=A0A4R2JFP0_9PSEU|nr:serine/threonine-protein kinase [Actinocrispum wychmicini]TCO55109.1 serine/threonine-protein kinase [Actinocrispum wychmicini]
MTAPLSMVNALPQYAIGDKIGEGGMGVVFAGVHRSLGRHVAIKQLPHEVSDRAEASSKFDREARVLASLDHPHIVPVYDYVQNLLVMEKLDGGTVSDRFHAGRINPEQACAITLAMLAGLHAAHLAGVLHLDVKPKNLLFNSNGVVKVADFGIARVISEGATLVTHSGEVVGTPAYIAPEQASGSALGPAADVYSAGTVLYELLSGEIPFDRTRGGLALMRQHMFADPKPIQRVPELLASVVMRGVAREQHDRYREAESFAVDLATAATTVFGQGWLERSGIPVLHLTPRVLSALSGTTAPGTYRDGATVVTPKPPAADPTLVGRPRPVTVRRRPLIPGLVAGVALVAVFVVAFLSPAVLPHSFVTPVSVAGAPATGPATVDLSKPLEVTGRGSVEGPVEVSLAGASVPLSSATRAANPGGGGSFSAQVEMPAITRWIVGGAVTGSVSWTEVDGSRVVQDFTLVTQQHPLASAMGTGSLLLALFALAYLESTMRTLRRGYRRPAARYTSSILGALFGLAAWLFVSVMAVHEPSLWYGIGCAVAGAVGASFAIAATERRAALRTD